MTNKKAGYNGTSTKRIMNHENDTNGTVAWEYSNQHTMHEHENMRLRKGSPKSRDLE
jgi:hypothetical protein